MTLPAGLHFVRTRVYLVVPEYMHHVHHVHGMNAMHVEGRLALRTLGGPALHQRQSVAAMVQLTLYMPH
jgi:hypothetical protein